jgi:DNA-binding NtrC family response regulator
MNGNVNVIVIDDDESIRKSISIILEDEGCKVDTAESGAEGITKSKAKTYNLALIDFRLGDIEGTKLLTLLSETNPKMRKVMVTGFPTVNNAIEALNHGANAYITKPFEPELLVKTVKEQLAEQEGEEKYGEQKVADFIKTRAKEYANDMLPNAP